MTCRSCKAQIEWKTLPSGARHPFDARPRLLLPGDGRDRGWDVERGGWVSGTLIPAGEPEVGAVNGDGGPGFCVVLVSHFASCPQAGSWRRR